MLDFWGVVSNKQNFEPYLNELFTKYEWITIPVVSYVSITCYWTMWYWGMVMRSRFPKCQVRIASPGFLGYPNGVVFDAKCLHISEKSCLHVEESFSIHRDTLCQP